jgi:large subunit ribosomal protein L25
MYELLKAEFRDDKTKAPLKKMRKDGFVPGVIFGKEMETVLFKVPFQKISTFLAHSGKVFQVEVDGKGKHLVNLEDIQWNHLGNEMFHISFHKIAENEKTTVTLPIVIHGEAVGTKEGGIINQVLNEVQVKGLPKDMPEFVEVIVDELAVGGHIALKDVKAPKGLEWAHDIEDNIVSCHLPKVHAVEEPVAEEEVSAEAAVVEEASAEEKQAA